MGGGGDLRGRVLGNHVEIRLREGERRLNVQVPLPPSWNGEELRDGNAGYQAHSLSVEGCARRYRRFLSGASGQVNVVLEEGTWGIAPDLKRADVDVGRLVERDAKYILVKV
ncbi:hypothetical protein GCM10008957_35270 [Deinococcus ruber]|uniref:Uncharacterized protein n=1 Tax=Deinococcus ruber TaxID=1848197 RepID=A0A918F8Q7_9DEIO|nr:hypothetical protein GCM10008957_35270 [Deinococcus ruber]